MPVIRVILITVDICQMRDPGVLGIQTRSGPLHFTFFFFFLVKESLVTLIYHHCEIFFDNYVTLTVFISELIHGNESQIKAVVELLYLWYFAIYPAIQEAKKLCGTGKYCIHLMFLQQQIWKSIHFSTCLMVYCCYFLNLMFLSNQTFQYWKWNLVLRSPEMQILSTASSKQCPPLTVFEKLSKSTSNEHQIPWFKKIN